MNWSELFSLPFNTKLEMSKERIRDFYLNTQGKVYISFSGGKDSTVLLHLVKSEFEDVPAVFINTGNEYPEIVDYVKTYENIEIVSTTYSIFEIIKQYGYPLISKELSNKISRYKTAYLKNNIKAIKHLETSKKFRIPMKWRFLKDAPFKISGICCKKLKINPILDYELKTKRSCYIGTKIADSFVRRQVYLNRGNCNFYSDKRNMSSPLSLWNDTDIYYYIQKYNLKLCNLYQQGYERTGCMLCGFGLFNSTGRKKLSLMEKTHKKFYNYMMNDLGYKEILNYIDNHLSNNKQELLWE